MRNLTLLVIVVCLFGCVNSDIRRTPPISQKGQVSLLTLNVAGLPDFLTSQDHPKERMYGMQHYANAYDIVSFQEDFYYSRHLDRQARFKHIERGSKCNGWSLVWPWLRKSGLTLQTSLPQTGTRFKAFSTCDGHFKHGNDCWVSKGVLCSRVIRNDGIIMHVCTTHMDAGQRKEGVEARAVQIQEYLAHLPEPETDRPWILIELGDYNMRPHEEAMKLLMMGKDVVVYDFEGPNQVDYIMITTNDLLDVDVDITRMGGASQFDGWSDHNAVEVVLDLRLRR